MALYRQPPNFVGTIVLFADVSRITTPFDSGCIFMGTSPWFHVVNPEGKFAGQISSLVKNIHALLAESPFLLTNRLDTLQNMLLHVCMLVRSAQIIIYITRKIK